MSNSQIQKTILGLDSNLLAIINIVIFISLSLRTIGPIDQKMHLIDNFIYKYPLIILCISLFAFYKKLYIFSNLLLLYLVEMLSYNYFQFNKNNEKQNAF